MPQVVPTTSPFAFSTLRDLFADTNPVNLGDYYSGVEYTPNGQGVPSTGSPISISQLRGIFTQYRVVNYYAASTTFTVPTGITRIFAIVVGGGGNSGLRYAISANDPVTPPTYTGTGGAGGFGGMAIVYQNVTPGAALTVTVGGYGGTSSFNGMTATGGGTGGNSTQTGGGDLPITYTTGATGANGTSSGTNYVTAPALATNVTAATWLSELTTLIPSFVGTMNVSNRSSLTTVSNQTANRMSGSTWNSAGSMRPGAGASAKSTGGAGAFTGTYGAVIVCY